METANWCTECQGNWHSSWKRSRPTQFNNDMCFKVWWDLQWPISYTITDKSEGERILKTVQQVPKLWARIECTGFFHSPGTLANTLKNNNINSSRKFFTQQLSQIKMFNDSSTYMMHLAHYNSAVNNRLKQTTPLISHRQRLRIFATGTQNKTILHAKDTSTD